MSRKDHLKTSSISSDGPVLNPLSSTLSQGRETRFLTLVTVKFFWTVPVISARFDLNYVVKLILHESVFRASVGRSLVQLKAIYVVMMFVAWIVLLVARQL